MYYEMEVQYVTGIRGSFSEAFLVRLIKFSLIESAARGGGLHRPAGGLKVSRRQIIISAKGHIVSAMHDPQNRETGTLIIAIIAIEHHLVWKRAIKTERSFVLFAGGPL